MKEKKYSMNSDEIICEWMQKRPAIDLIDAALKWQRGEDALADWWVLAADLQWHSRILDLDALWLVEQKLSDEQWLDYVNALIDSMPHKFPRKGEIIHATPAQKISALERVLRQVTVSGRAEEQAE